MAWARKNSGKRDYLHIAGEELRPGVPHIRAVEDVAEFEVSPDSVFKARWPIFIPTLVIAVLYAGAWLYLFAQSRQDTSLARLFLIILAVGVPLIAAHAFLRFQTIRVQVLPKGIRYHPGWPKDLPVDLPYELLERIRVKRNLISLLCNTGTLVLELTTGEKVSIADLSNPLRAKAEIESAMDIPEN